MAAELDLTALSQWSDSTTGVTERAFFIDVESSSVFVVEHRPKRPNGAAVVMCGSLFEEVRANYRRELMVARRLATAGFLVVRFQPRGIGNAGDLGRDGPTMATILADTRLVVGSLRETHAGSISMIGYRAGSLVVAEQALEIDGWLLFWNPVRSGRDYLRELSRANRVATLRTAAGTTTSATGAAAEPSVVELLGYDVSPAMVSSLDDVRLDRDLGSPRSVLVVQEAKATALRPPVAAVVDGWRAAGNEVAEELVNVRKEWWFIPDVWIAQEAETETIVVADAIVAWASGQLTGSASQHG